MPFSDFEIVLVDLVASAGLIEAEEARTPRLGAADVVRAARLGDDPQAQGLWRAARIATRIVLERAAGAGIRGMDFAIAAGGRPSLGAGFPSFNVSHTGDVALIAVSSQSSLGADIEQRKSLSMTADRRERIVRAAAAMGGASPFDSDDDTDVLRAWVRLEAVAKARGTGIGVLLTEEGVIGGVGGRSAQSQVPLAVAELDVGADYVAAVASTVMPDHPIVRHFPTRVDEFAAFMANPHQR
jgi:4'-phosphopantetheinyl transferase